MNFIGRKEELTILRGLLAKRSTSLVIMKGRRRIGKSRLIKEFGKEFEYYEFSGTPPTAQTTAQSERDIFAKQLKKHFKLSHLQTEDWSDLFTELAKKTKTRRVVILFDEISWLGSKDPMFLGKLKNAWDMEFKNNPKLILILCGSVSAWIEKNIINSTGFVGRPSLYINLEELTLPDCNRFWDKYGEGVSAYEKLKMLSVMGGVPRYLELMNPQKSAEENIKQLCFMKHSPLLDEFDHIFTDIFSKNSVRYKDILEQLTQGIADQEQLAKALKLSRSGDLSDQLNDLVLAGFLARDYTWHIKTGEVSKLSAYRLKDNYVRFYLKYIAPNKEKIRKGLFTLKSLSGLPGWDSIIGLQFENLVLNNHHTLIRALGIPPEDVVFANPFFQRKTAVQAGCQIDYLIQTRFHNVYICEIKFSQFEMGPEVIRQVKEKIKRLVLPRHVSYRPVLIHVNGVRQDVEDSGFFSNLVDFRNLLEPEV
jgi:AAA+ ATPase superfamily predicted ATPase